MFDMTVLLSDIQKFGLTVLKAAVVFFIGWVLIRYAIRLLVKWLKFRRMDEGLYAFIESVTRILLIVLLALACCDIINIDITPFLTALGATGLAVALAFKDSLSNLAGGAFILVTKPFGQGDYVAIGPTEGIVHSILLLHTALTTIDNKRVLIPNNAIASATILNYSVEPLRRLDLTFAIPLNADWEKAERVILSVVREHPLSRDNPAEPIARVSGYTDYSTEIVLRVWTENASYWPLRFDLNERIGTALADAGLPFPLRRTRVSLDGLPNEAGSALRENT